MHSKEPRNMPPGCSVRAIISVSAVAKALIVLLLWVVPPLSGQEGGRQVSLPHDWSSRHVIYTKKLTEEDLKRARNEPRFYHSWLLQGHAVISSTRPISKGVSIAATTWWTT